ncbi:MAG: hypothetical protein AAFX95_15440 [Cyanobacteria bacterium J06639_16]
MIPFILKALVKTGVVKPSKVRQVVTDIYHKTQQELDDERDNKASDSRVHQRSEGGGRQQHPRDR